MAAVAIEHLSRAAPNVGAGVAYVFCSYKAQFNQSVADMLAAIVKQLVTDRLDLATPIFFMYDLHSSRGSRSSLDELLQALNSICSSYSVTYLVVDALDECSDTNSERSNLSERLRELQSSCNLRLLATSRFIPEIVASFHSDPHLEVQASDEDVRRFVAGQIPRLPKCVQNNVELINDVQNKIVDTVEGM